MTVPCADLREPSERRAHAADRAACLPLHRDEARPNREQGITPRGPPGPREPPGRRPRAASRAAEPGAARRRRSAGSAAATPADAPSRQRRRRRAPAVASGSDPARRRRSSSATGRDHRRRRGRDRRPRRRLRVRRLDRGVLHLRPQFSPSPTPTVAPGSSTRLGFFEDDMGASHACPRPAEVPASARPPPATTATSPGYGSDPAAGLQAGRQGRPAELGPQPRARRRWSSCTGTIRRARPPPASSAFRDYFEQLPGQPDLQAPGGSALAGHRPLRRHAAPVRGRSSGTASSTWTPGIRPWRTAFFLTESPSGSTRPAS